jgi:uncharacterized protein (TIGR03790 family)
VLLLFGFSGFSSADAQTTDNVLVVVNDASADSARIGEYYSTKRSVSPDHVLHLKTAVTDGIERVEFTKTIEAPLAAWLSRNRLQDRILYIVLTKGVPLRINGTVGLDGTVASVDSELTLLYRKLVGTSPIVGGRVANPYFLGTAALSEAKPFTRVLSDIYLVTRLDGYTVEDVMKLIDKGVAPSQTGKIVLDEKATVIDRGGDEWLEQTADRLKASGATDRVVLETTRAVATASGPVIGYYSWGSNDPANQLRQFGLQFAPGAIGGMFVSTDGRTFSQPPADWKPSDPNGRGPRFAGSFQSLAGDLIRDGITGVSAHVAEPFLDATIRPQILFPAYLAGFNLAESFYLAMPFLSWQTVIVGDPLCTPFSRTALQVGPLDKGMDSQTELPAIFSERRLALVGRGALNVEALKLSLKAESLTSRGNASEAEKVLERATEMEPRLTTAQVVLASTYETRGEYDKAIDRYRRILAVEPQNAIALNNLAYGLAVRKQLPKDALPLAQRAFNLAPTPVVADTLGWIHHLLGDDRTALPLLDRAVAGSPENADVLVHAATVHIALNQKDKARGELDAAEKLNPQLAQEDGFRRLRAQVNNK